MAEALKRQCFGQMIQDNLCEFQMFNHVVRLEMAFRGLPIEERVRKIVAIKSVAEKRQVALAEVEVA